MPINRDLTPTDGADIAAFVRLIHDRPVVLDRDLAKIYKLDVKSLNRVRARHAERFPEDFCFKLTQGEASALDLPDNLKQTYVYTEPGIAMLAMLLATPAAVKSSVAIIRAFVETRGFIVKNAPLFSRVDELETKQKAFQVSTDQKLAKLLAHLEAHECADATQKIFFSGQIYDAYSFLSGLIAKAKKELIVVDGYVNVNTLDLLRSKRPGVSVELLTLPSSHLSNNEVKKFNSEYPTLTIHRTKDFHDRLLILDRKSLYHVGASLKDAGEKSFAITKLEEEYESSLLLSRIDSIINKQ